MQPGAHRAYRKRIPSEEGDVSLSDSRLNILTNASAEGEISVAALAASQEIETQSVRSLASTINMHNLWKYKQLEEGEEDNQAKLHVSSGSKQNASSNLLKPLNKSLHRLSNKPLEVVDDDTDEDRVSQEDNNSKDHQVLDSSVASN